MILGILEVLKNDVELKALLKATARDSKIHMFGTKEGIAYKWVPLTSNSIKRQDRLEITAVHADYEIANNIVERVKQLLLTTGDTAFNNRILSITQNGGGCIENPDTHDINLSCSFVVRSREI